MASSYRIRLLVLHGDPITRIGVASALGSCVDIEIVDDSGPSEHRMSYLFDGGPCPVDVVLADYGGGVAIASESSRREPGGAPRVLTVSGVDREWEVRNA